MDTSREKSRTKRKEIALDLLRTYFIFKDCADEGEKLIEEAGADPATKIRKMDDWKAASTLKRWEEVLGRQSTRLQLLQEYLYGAHHLSVINPDLQQQISKVIGSKFDRATSLHSIGAALFFKSIFRIEESNDERASYVALMAGSDNNLLDINIIQSEILAMRNSLNEYRSIVERLLSDEEILVLSREARNYTLIEKYS